jgi:TPR repeat protein
LRSGEKGFHDLASAARYFKLAADQNHAEAQFEYAVCLSEGLGVSVDLCAAAKYYKLSADQNHAKAQFCYAECILEGRGVPVDLSEAVKYYKLAADQNHGPAQLRYAKCLSASKDVPAVTKCGQPVVDPHLQFRNGIVLWRGCDFGEAVKCFRLAAVRNHIRSMFYYAICLSTGRGVSVDLAQAAEYFKLAADRNHPGSQFCYGLCLLAGRGVQVDSDEGLRYLERAVNCNPLYAHYAYYLALLAVRRTEFSGVGGCSSSGSIWPATSFEFSTGANDANILVGIRTGIDGILLSPLASESTSTLTRFEGNVFSVYSSLKSLSSPASVQLIDGSAFSDIILSTNFQEGSRRLRVSGNFLLRADYISGIRSCGSNSNVAFKREFQILNPNCFHSCDSLCSFRFESGSKSSRIEAHTLSHCSSLRSFCLPASVKFLGLNSFSWYQERIHASHLIVNNVQLRPRSFESWMNFHSYTWKELDQHWNDNLLKDCWISSFPKSMSTSNSISNPASTYSQIGYVGPAFSQSLASGHNVMPVMLSALSACRPSFHREYCFCNSSVQSSSQGDPADVSGLE